MRTTRTWISGHRGAASLIAIAGIAVLGFAVYWFGPQRLFFDQRVNEALPGLDLGDGGGESLHLGQASKGGSKDDRNDENKAETAQAGPVVLAQGEFRSLAHGSSGTVLVVDQPDGSRILRFEDLDTSNGPDLRVYLSKVPAGDDAAAFDDEVIDLGALKGNQGDQNYEIPESIDEAAYRCAVVWCRRFTVGFAAAPLDSV
jgi:electron transfer DM13